MNNLKNSEVGGEDSTRNRIMAVLFFAGASMGGLNSCSHSESHAAGNAIGGGINKGVTAVSDNTVGYVGKFLTGVSEGLSVKSKEKPAVFQQNRFYTFNEGQYQKIEKIRRFNPASPKEAIYWNKHQNVLIEQNIYYLMDNGTYKPLSDF